MNYTEHVIIGQDRKEDWLISTIKVAYSNIYETAICLEELGDWHVVEEYNTKEEAIKGHEKYKEMTDDELNKLSLKPKS